MRSMLAGLAVATVLAQGLADTSRIQTGSIRLTLSRRNAVAEITSVEGDSMATGRVVLEKSNDSRLSAQVDYVTAGPWARIEPAGLPEAPVDSTGAMAFRLLAETDRLRVAINSCERTSWLTIDHILGGRADTRVVKAQYRLDPFMISELWKRVKFRNDLRDGPAEPPSNPVKWIDAKTFEWWLAPGTTLTVEQLADSLFQVTARSRFK